MCASSSHFSGSYNEISFRITMMTISIASFYLIVFGRTFEGCHQTQASCVYVFVTLLLSNPPVSKQRDKNLNVNFQVFTSIPIHTFQLWGYVWISTPFPLPVQNGLFPIKCCEFPHTCFLTSASLLVKHTGLLYTFLFIMSHDPDYFVTDHCWSYLAFFHIFRWSLVEYPKFCKIALVTLKNSIIIFLPGNITERFILIFVTPYQLQLPLFLQRSNETWDSCHQSSYKSIYNSKEKNIDQSNSEAYLIGLLEIYLK